HLLSEVQELCDRVAVVHRGQVRAEGNLTDLLRDPDHMYEFEVAHVPQAQAILGSLAGAQVAAGARPNWVRVSGGSDIGRIAIRALLAGNVDVTGFWR